MRRSNSLLAILTAASLMLTGCSALLDREFSDITPHNTAPTTDGDLSIPRADSYSELVNVLIYLVGSGIETGTIRLYIDTDDIEAALAAACLEVVQEDPLGAYAVEDIRYSVVPVVTYAQADVQISYRRTQEQVRSIVQATGTSAIRSELASALASFATERVLRISYFEGDEAFIRDLVRQAYYNSPGSAMGMPEVSVTIYPDSGRQRIVELLLDYPLEPSQLLERQQELLETVDSLAMPLSSLSGRARILGAAQALVQGRQYHADGGSTPYDLFHDGAADSEGFALAMSLLCQQLGLPCQIAQGTYDGAPHFWNVVHTDDGWRHLDLTAPPLSEEQLYTDDTLQALGYVWPEGVLPPCVAR